MNAKARKTLNELKTKLRAASLAQIGGFRPPDNPLTSWFGKGVCRDGEALTVYKGRELFPLLQVNISELPYIPDGLSGVKLLVVYFNRDELPFDQPNGDGWLIREYSSLEALVPLPDPGRDRVVKSFPIKWNLSETDAPGWETADALVDMSPVNDDEDAEEYFNEKLDCSSGTKFGGYPLEIQHAPRLENFIFQIGSEEKAGWMWADNGVAHFYRDRNGVWSWDCQFY